MKIWINRLYSQFFFMRLRTRILLYLMLFVILGSSVLILYRDYENSLVQQQQQHMLSVSKSISRSIELFMSEVVDSMKVLTFDQTFVERLSEAPGPEALDYYDRRLKSYALAEGSPVYGVYLFDSRGRIFSEYSAAGAKSSILKQEGLEAVRLKKPYIGQAYLDPQRHAFILNLYEPVFKNGAFMGLLCVSIDLDVIYDKLIDPVKIGKKGYALVKDQEGTIIMHKLKEQVGINVITTRKAMYPDLDFSELEALIDEQMRSKEGTFIYHSYWWADEKLQKVKKLNAFSPVALGDRFWVVALTMSYEEIKAPMNQFLFGIFLIALFVAVVFHLFIQALTRARRSKEELEQETQYLKMLNESSEQLRQQEAELYHSQKLKMIGTLAGGISHDINNLLTPIYGYAELMLAQMDEKHPFHEEVSEIYAASQRGKDLIEQLLLFSRKDNGMTSSSLVDVNQVTEDTLRLVKTMLPKHIRIQTDLEPGCGHVLANFTQLHQVIFNLCTNAYQALIQDRGEGAAGETGEGLIAISLKKIPVSLMLESDSDDGEGGTNHRRGEVVELTIQDSGCGMDEATKERIFEPFFTTKEIGDGTGLGLFVVKSIIDKYGGHIRVESAPGVGSTFKVYFALVSDAERANNPAAAEEPAPMPSQNCCRVLVVDDNDNVTRLLKKGLETHGFQVTAETDSLRALKRFKAAPDQFDLLLTDYMMPDLNGLDLAAKARRLRPDVGVILMTGFMDESQIGSASHEAVDHFLLKPIEMNRLSETIRKVCYNRHQAAKEEDLS